MASVVFLFFKFRHELTIQTMLTSNQSLPKPSRKIVITLYYYRIYSKLPEKRVFHPISLLLHVSKENLLFDFLVLYTSNLRNQKRTQEVFIHFPRISMVISRKSFCFQNLGIFGKNKKKRF